MPNLHKIFPIILLVLLVEGCALIVPIDSVTPITLPTQSSLDKKKFIDDLHEEQVTFSSDEEFVVLISKKNDTLESLAKKYLGDSNKAWLIADFNNIDRVVPRREIVIPLKPQNPGGVFINGFQTIPILCYHRFGDTGHIKLTVSEEKFRQQMQFLKDNGYRVIALSELPKFISGAEELPKKSVVITIDDGYRSTFEIAYPILKTLDFPATLFLYTDFTGAGDAIKWSHAKNMTASGLIDIQPHSKTHPNMSLTKTLESQSDYQKRIFEEIDNPGIKITKHIKSSLHTFAYPYGDTNQLIIGRLKEIGYELGVTVQPGGNPAYAHPYMLHRTMIFGDSDIKDFENALVVFQERNLK